MPLRFSWDDSYLVGNELIDSQHQQLFALVNSLGEDANEQKVNQVLAELKNYARIHFTAEEGLMRNAAFPLLSEHKLLHDHLNEQLTIMSSHDLSDEKAIFAVRKFVFEWLVNHILQEDMRYVTHLREQSKSRS